jgi:uncharacterized membrane protein YjjB (DUF3815 family)
MNPRIRAALAILAGVVVGGLVIGLIEMASPYRPPEGLDLNDRSALGHWISSLPFGAFGLLLLAYFLGSMAGGFVTNWLSKPTRYRPALIVGFALFVAGLMNLIAIPHPVWFTIASSLLYFLGAWLGGRLPIRAL